MKILEMPIAEVKKRFSEAVNQTVFSTCRVVITKRSRPVAALINLNDLRQLEQQEKRAGLASVVNQWRRFDEIEPSVAKAVRARRKEGVGRRVSL